MEMERASARRLSRRLIVQTAQSEFACGTGRMRTSNQSLSLLNVINVPTQIVPNLAVKAVRGQSTGSATGTESFVYTGLSNQQAILSVLGAGYIPGHTIGSISGSTTVTQRVASVPGPIAGAGLPVLLGLFGFASWRRRVA